MPSGASTPLVVGNRIFLTAHEDHELSTYCVDRTNGNVMWKESIRVEKLEPVHAEGNPASATPACDGRRVYSFFGSFGLLCYSLEGAQVWSKPLGPFRDEFGSSSSPILVDGKIIGAIGVSGVTSTQDGIIAQAGLDALAKPEN